jgi:hypothetical protein
MVSSPLIARTPTSSGWSTRPRSSGDWSLPASGHLPAPRIGPSPSIGLPDPSTTRPSIAGPTSASPGGPIGRTGALGSSAAGPPRFIISVLPPRKPMTSASTRLEPVPIAQTVPTGSERPTASINSPSKEESRPETFGLATKSRQPRPSR